MFVEEYLIELRRERYTPAAFARYARRSSARSRANAYRNPDCVRSVVVNGIGFFIFFVVVALAVAYFVDSSLAYRLMIYQGSWIAFGTTWLLLHVGLLRDARGEPLPSIGLPNQLSFLRLLMIPTIYLFIVEGYLALALSAYVLAGITDILDGLIARRTRLESRLGLVLDPIVDVGYVVSIFAAFHRVGWIPTWFIVLVLARYTLLFGGGTIIYFARGRVTIRPTAFGRTTGLVISAIILSLFGLALAGDANQTSGVRRVLTAALGFLFAAACVQLVIIGMYNLRGGEEGAPPHRAVAGDAGPPEGSGHER